MMNDERNAPRKPGRPATYVFNKPDSELTDAERKRKLSIEKRRLRQNRSYHRRKALRAAAAEKNFEGDAILPGIPHERVVPSIEHNPNFSGNPNDPFARLEPGSSLFPTALPISNNGNTNTNRPTFQDLDSETLATRWNLPKSSVIPELQSKQAMSNFNLSQHANPMDDLSMVVPGLFDNADDDMHDDGMNDGTDMLVQNALVAAKQANDVRSTVDKQRDMMRIMGIKDMVFDNLRTQINNMSGHVQNALQHFVVFPSTFDSKAAIAIANVDAFVNNEIMQELIGFNFVQTCGKGRFKLNDTVKIFVKEESNFASNLNNMYSTTTTTTNNIASSDYTNNISSTALRRFRTFFRKQLDEFKGENIHKVGWQREKAMLVYDSERTNMEFAIALCQKKSKRALRDFLSAAITVMRYCVTASERERILQEALSDDDSGNGSSSNGTEDDEDEEDEEIETLGGRLQDLANKARLQLGLAEAYFDQLKFSEAEAALLKALNLMGGNDADAVDGRKRMDSSFFATSDDIDGTSRVVDSVLVLLLLSNVRMAKRRVKEARTLCVKALRILAAAGLGRSTFGINAMANLTVIYLEENQTDKASVVATRLVDTLNNMGYQTMPIFADALGVVGMVSMKRGKYYDAEQQFGSALEIVKLWSAKDWTSMPIHHCADLDIRLLENMAESLLKQEKREVAELLAQQARSMGAKRGLCMERIHAVGSSGGVEGLKLATRHLY